MGEDNTIITHADVYTQDIPSTFDSVMMSSGDSSPPPVQPPISSTGFDVPDDAKLRKAAPTTSAKTLKSTNADAEAIVEAAPIVQTNVPAPEPKPTIERNGLDTVDAEKVWPNEPEDDSCLIDCIYYTQKCCECTII